MGDIKKVKLMDSGTVRFQANGQEDAVRKVRAVLSLYGAVSMGPQESPLGRSATGPQETHKEKATGQQETHKGSATGQQAVSADTVPEAVQAQLILDCSDSLYHQFVTAVIEPTSIPNQWAASFREGNAATTLGLFLLRLGALSTCHKRMEAIIDALDNK